MGLGQKRRGLLHWDGLRWVRLRRFLGVWLLVLLFGLGFGFAMATAARSEVRPGLVAQAVRPVEPFTVNGRLDQNSERMRNGNSYFNIHQFEGTEGSVVAINLVSQEFDTYLILIDPQGNKIAENDDSDGTNARIAIELPTTGTYTIIANALNAGETGSYTLSLRTATAAELALTEADQLNQQVTQLYRQGRYAEATPLAEQALQIREQQLGKDHSDVATSLNNLALLYQDQGRYSEAEPLLQRSLAILEQQLGKDHPDVAANLNNLASLYRMQGRYSEAELFFQRSLTILEQQLGEDHPDVATSLNNLALLYHEQGRYGEAEPLLQRSLTILEQQLGKDHPGIATYLNNLALLYHEQGRYGEAEPLLQRSLTILEQQLGQDHPNFATSLNNLAGLYQLQGYYSEAESLYRRSLTISEQQLGQDHPDVAMGVSNLASLYKEQGRYGEAEPLLQRSLTILEQQLGKDHPDVATSLNNLALLYWAEGAVADAVSFFERGMQVEETNLSLNLALGSETRKQAYIATIAGSTEAMTSLHLKAAADNPEAAKLAFITILRRKGRVLDAVSDNLRQLRQTLEPEDQTLFDQLNRLRAQQGALMYSGLASQSPEAYKTQMATLRTQAEALESTLAQRSNEVSIELQPVTLESVQTLIPADAALLELVRYRPVDPKVPQAERWGTPRYAAYVLHPNGDLKWADLGEAEPIDQLADQFRASLRSQSGSVKTLGRDLDAKLMQPIRALLNGKTQVLISPDSQLNLIPFAALVDEQNRYLIETHSFTYLTSGRDLLRFQIDPASRQVPVLLANPDYADPGDPTPARIASLTGSPTQAAAIPGPAVQPALDRGTVASQRGASQRSGDLASLTYQPLEGTQREIDAIRPLLTNPAILTGAAATESTVKQLQAPSILHIATHGFFLQDADCFAAPDTRGDGGVELTITGQPTCRPTPQNTENPLLRSGLALAGFNSRQGGDGEDGVLTAMEASGLNLYGTKLVVLSACETGLGAVANGEGVYGLRRAFVMAGAESQLMSLWKVDDAATAELMARYYQQIQQQQGRSQALHQIQQDFLKIPAYSHPYYWASFIFSGDWQPLEAP